MNRGVAVLVRITCTVYWLTLFVVTHLPPSRVPVTKVNDKLEHALSYALLATLLYFSLAASRIQRRSLAMTTLSIVLGFGVFDELTQLLVGRDCELYDWLADAAGAIIAIAVVHPLRQFRIVR